MGNTIIVLWLLCLLNLSTLSDPSLHAPQLSVIIIQSRLPCPLPHLQLFFSFFPSHLCVSPANLSRQTPYQPVFSSDTAVAPSSQQRKNCTFYTISSLTWSHFSHQSFSSSLLWCQLYCLRQIPVRGCVDAGVNMKTNSCWKQAYVKIEAADCWLFLVCVVWYLFCTMIMAIQSEGYTCFPIRSLKSRNDSIRKSCRE